MVEAKRKVSVAQGRKAAGGCLFPEEEQAMDADKKERQIGDDVKKVGNTEKRALIRELIICLGLWNATVQSQSNSKHCSDAYQRYESFI